MTVNSSRFGTMSLEDQAKSELAKAWAFFLRPDLRSDNVQIVARSAPRLSEVAIHPRPEQSVVAVLVDQATGHCEFIGWARGKHFKERRSNSTIATQYVVEGEPPR